MATMEELRRQMFPERYPEQAVTPSLEELRAKMFPERRTVEPLEPEPIDASMYRQSPEMLKREFIRYEPPQVAPMAPPQPSGPEQMTQQEIATMPLVPEVPTEATGMPEQLPTEMMPEDQALAVEMQELKKIENAHYKELATRYKEERDKRWKDGSLTTYWPEDYADLELYPDANRSFWGVLANEPLSMVRGITQPVVSALRLEDPDIRLGRRVQETQQGLTLKGAKEKLSKGTALSEEEVQSVKNDVGLWNELKLAAKYIRQRPGEFVSEVGISIAEDLPLLLLSNKGVGSLFKAAHSMAGKSKQAYKTLKRMRDIKKKKALPQGRPMAPGAKPTSTGQIIAEDIFGETVVEAGTAKGRGQKYTVAEAAGAIVPGTALGAAEVGIKKGLRRAKEGAAPPTITPEAFKYPGDSPDIGPLSTEYLPAKPERFAKTKKFIKPVKAGFEKARESIADAKNWLKKKPPVERTTSPDYVPRYVDYDGRVIPSGLEELATDLARATPEKPNRPKVNPSETIVFNPTKVETETGYLNKIETQKFKWIAESEPLLKVQRIYEKETGKKLTDDKHLAHRIDQVLGHQLMAEGYVRERLFPIVQGGKFKGKDLAKLTPDQTRGLSEYLIAKRMKWLYQQQKGEKIKKFVDRLYTEDWADEVIKKHDKTPLLRERSKLIWDYNQEMLVRLLNAGHITEKEFKHLAKDPYYVPLQRDLRQSVAQESGLPNVAEIFTSADKGVVGFHSFPDRDVPVHNPFSSMIDNTVNAFGAITKARVFNAIVDMAESSETIGKIIKPLPDETIDLDPGRAKLKVIRKGQIEWFDVPIEIFEATTDMGRFGQASNSGFMNSMRKLANVFRAGTVRFNPGFSISNAFRDQADAMFYSGKSPFALALRGLTHFAKKDEVYQAFIKGGGGIGGLETGVRGAGNLTDEMMYGGGSFNYNKIRDIDRWDSRFWPKKDKKPEYGIEYTQAPFKKTEDGKYVIDNVGAEMEKHGSWADKATVRKLFAGGKETIESVGDVMGFLNEYSEMMTRLGTFEHSILEGKTPREAIHISRNASIDFMAMGRKMRKWNQIIPFLNPSVRGVYMLQNKLRKDPGAVLKGAMKWGYLPTAALTAYNATNENYKNISTREKQNNYIIMKDETGKEYYKVPKGHAMKFLLNPFQMALEKGVGLSDISWTDIGKYTVAEAVPVGPSGLIPPLLKTPVEVATNWDLYWRKHIYDDKAPPALRAKSYTSQSLKDLAFAIDGIPNIHKLPEAAQVLRGPAVMQKVGEGVGGGTATNILFLADLARGKIGRERLKPQHLPLLRRLVGESQVWKSDIERKLREKRNSLIGVMRGKIGMARPYVKGDVLDPRWIKAVEKFVKEGAAEYEELEEAQKLLKGAEAAGWLEKLWSKLAKRLESQEKE